MQARGTITEARAGRARGRWLRAAVLACVAVVVFAACEPEPPPPPPPPPPTTPPPPPPPPKPECGSVDEVDAESYVATVEVAGRREAVRFRARSAGEREERVERIRREGKRVVVVEPEQVVEALAIDDPHYWPAPPGQQPANGQWGIARVGAEAAWGDPPLQQGQGNPSPVKVAVVDTGVQADHPDLIGRVLPGIDYIALPGYGYDGRFDGNGHGTHVAGTVAENDNTIGGIGVAPQASILPVRVLGCNGSGSTGNVANGIYWAVDNGAHVINLSLGTGAPSETVRLAVQAALDAGVVVVAAGGNSGAKNNNPLYPAAHSPQMPGLLAVGATTQADTRASFSNYGPYINIAAPGNLIWSTIPTSAYGHKSGTSMAAPHVAGAAALVLAKCPGLNALDVAQRLLSTAEDLGPAGWDPEFGSGLVRADRAVAPAC